MSLCRRPPEFDAVVTASVMHGKVRPIAGLDCHSQGLPFPEFLYGVCVVVFPLGVNAHKQAGKRGLCVAINGTALAFADGTEVHGLDSSQEMLDVCREKGITKDLKLFDLNQERLPFRDNVFNHIVSCGVFHFFRNLDHFFNESKRVLKTGGMFSFTIMLSQNGVEGRKDKESGMMVFRHSEDYIKDSYKKHNFEVLKQLNFLGFDSEFNKIDYKAYVLRKK